MLPSAAMAVILLKPLEWYGDDDSNLSRKRDVFADARMVQGLLEGMPRRQPEEVSEVDEATIPQATEPQAASPGDAMSLWTPGLSDLCNQAMRLRKPEQPAKGPKTKRQRRRSRSRSAISGVRLIV